jgi:hypothetical protein
MESRFVKNTEKNEIYKYLMSRTNLAIKYDFDIQAIANCYAIFEDRLEAILKYSKVSFNEKSFTTITGKIKFINSNVSKTKLNPYVDEGLIKLLENWVKERNKIFHTMARNKFEKEYVKKVAEDGFKLAKLFSAQTIKYKKYLAK